MEILFKNNDINDKPFKCMHYNTRIMPFPIKLQWHYYGEMILLIKGKLALQIDTKKYNMEKGDFVLIFPETVHGIFSADENEAEYIIIEFDSQRMSELLDNTSNINIFNYARKNNFQVYFNHNIISRHNINDIIIECLEEFNKKSWGYELIIHNHLHNILVWIIRLWKKTDDFCCDNIVGKKIKYEFNNITEYIDKHINENIIVNDIAKLYGMSYSHFAKKFREVYGMSCKTYINKIRIMKIENLLTCSNHDLNYISQETGFSDCSHMIRVFKKVHNMTPNEFRKKQN